MARGRFQGGFGGGGNMNQLMKQAQKMQKEMEKMQEEMLEKEVTAKAGGGAVVVTATGDKKIKSIEIDKDLLDPEEVEMLQDLILIAVNDVIKKVEDMSANEMNKITGGMGGGFPGF